MLSMSILQKTFSFFAFQFLFFYKMVPVGFISEYMFDNFHSLHFFTSQEFNRKISFPLGNKIGNQITDVGNEEMLGKILQTVLVSTANKIFFVLRKEMG